MEKICVNKLVFSFFKVRQPANQRPSSSWGLFDKTILQIVPENGLLICASSLQVFLVIYKLMYKCFLQIKFKLYLQVLQCSYKCSLSNSNFNSKLNHLDSSFQAPSNYYKLCFRKLICLFQPSYLLYQLFSLVLNKITTIFSTAKLALDQF